MKNRFNHFFCLFGALLIASSCSCSSSSNSSTNSDFVQSEMQWRQERDQDMKKPSSWLTIAGLFWLEKGENTFGTAPQNSIQLPQDSAPAMAGTFILDNGEVKVVSSSQAELRINGEIIKEKVLQSDRTEHPDVIELNDLRMWVIQRSDRLAIRLRDLNAQAFKDYNGLHYFKPSEKYQVTGELVRYSTPKEVDVATVVGTEAEYISPGVVKFTIDDKKLQLQAFASLPDSTSLFFIFRDETSGNETYGAGRFMDATLVEDGSVDLNFNRAYNPPCAYTPYATCPLPPPENQLPIKIEAGEKNYGKGH